MLLWLLVPAALAASTCSNKLSDDHECLLQSAAFVTRDVEVSQEAQDLPNAQLEDAQANMEGLTKKLAIERGVAKNMRAAEEATRKEAASVFSQLEQVAAQLKDSQAHKDEITRTVHRASLKREQLKTKLLESKMEASWKKATEATEDALAAERKAEFRRQAAEKAERQNQAQRGEAAALRKAEEARRNQVMALRAMRDVTNATWDLNDEHATEIKAEPVAHVKPVKHAKAAVIKTRRAKRRAEINAAETASKAANASQEAWQWKKMYQATHPKARVEKQTIKESKYAFSAVSVEESNLLAEQARLQDKKDRLDAKLAELTAGTAEAEIAVAETERQHSSTVGEETLPAPVQ